MPRFQKLGHIALNVSDVERSTAFYRDLVGLTHSGTDPDSGTSFLRCSDDYQNIALYTSDRPGLKHVGWELENDATVDELAKELTERGIAFDFLSRAESDALHIDRALRVADPAGIVSIFYGTMWSFGGEPYVPTVAKIQRLGHIVLQVPDFETTLAFYTDVLGFNISDRFGDGLAFLRASPNPYHHSLAIARHPRGPHFHHLNFMVSEIDDIGAGFWRFTRAQVPIVHGPGRHPPSGSVFLYYLDPDGLTLEYSFGMEEFDETGFRKPRRLEKIPSSMDYWGAAIDPRKGAVGAIETVRPA